MESLAKNKRQIAFAALLLAGIALRANLWLLPMNDEVLYATFAIENHFRRMDADANPEHPPLAKWFLGIPSQFIAFNRSEFMKLGGEYMTLPPVPFVEELAQDLLPWMRGISAVFSLMLALLTFFFAKRWLGTDAALAAFLVLMLSPNLLLFSNAVMLDMVFLFFFTAAILFYLFEYSRNRDWPRRIALSALVFLAMSAKFYGFFAIVLVLLLEGLRFVREKKHDAWLLFSLWGMAIAFLAFSYPLPKILFALGHYFGGGLSLNTGLLAATISRVEPLLIFLVGLALYLHWKPVQRDETVDGLVVTAAFFLVTAAFNPIPFFRYSLAMWPFLALLAAWAFSRAKGWHKSAAVALGALLAVEAIAYYPYYDTYANPLAAAIRPPTVERAPALGADAFLKTVNGSIVTDDAYNLPFSFDYDARFLWHFAYEKGFMPRADTIFFAEALCFDEALMEEYLRDAGYAHLARRVDGLAEPPNCPALYEASSKLPKEYVDKSFEVYKLR